ncbi:MAG TPA: DUF72 domain-containing protein [Chloroflexota bacterium]|nr:DUF72 domain-containing protein [Chloroflexota bacterium]
MLAGSCSWADRTLIKEGQFYPASAKTPEARLRYYSERFPIVEADSPYYALPGEEQSQAWAERTPDDFIFDVKAFRLFTLHPAEPKVLPKDLREDLPADVTAKRRLYMKDLPERAQTQLWRRFRQGIEPLRAAGKLGVVLLQFPPWVFPSDESREHMLRTVEALAGFRLAVEFRHDSWVNDKNRERTLQFLQDHKLTYVCVDEPREVKGNLPPLVEVTTPDVAVFRFHGRDPEAWRTKADSAAERFKYFYSAGELEELAGRVEEAKADRKHALFNNCYRDNAVINALQMIERLRELHGE